MLAELAIYTGVASTATIAPVYKIRKGLAKLFKVPVIGIALSLAWAIGTGWLLLTIFSFQSSIAGLANLLSGIIFTAWLYFESKKLEAAKK